MSVRSLDRWLEYQQGLNPNLIDLGLERLRPVAARMSLELAGVPLVTVGGTNGKGSTVAMLESLCVAHGLRCGSYSSPHLERYNECVRIDAVAADDASIVESFARVEAVRHAVALTAFEFRTLAALDQLRRACVDLIVLEVGLGGRLDAVNILDADVAVITSIGLDHQQWLGDSLESIAAEKCGILRAGAAAVCADAEAARLIAPHAEAIGARLRAPGHGLGLDVDAGGWRLTLDGRALGPYPRPCLAGRHQVTNAACAVAAFHLLFAPRRFDQAAVARAMAQVRLDGRFQRLAEAPLDVVDVAHNAHATRALAGALRREYPGVVWRAVCAMYEDKDALAALAPLLDSTAHWYLAPLSPPRGGSAERLAAVLDQLGPTSGHTECESVEAAWRRAGRERAAGEGRVAFGSFETVRRVLALESAVPGPDT